MIYQPNLLNTTALSTPGVYTQIINPQTAVINGVPTNNLGIVGTASWGPVNTPTDFGSLQQGSQIFGPMQNRKYDLMTCAVAAGYQGATNFTGVRVTDGTDAAATYALSIAATLAITFTAKYTGSFGNGIQVTLGTGSAANSYSVTVAAPGCPSELFNNITGSGLALWQAIVAAINSGAGVLRGPSNLIVATVGTSTGAVPTATYTLAGGLDGATPGTSHVTVTTLVGSDTATPRTGMYALRAQNCSVVVLADADDNTQWTSQVAFGASEGVYVVGSTPSGDTAANAIAAKATAGIDSAWFKLMLGDWCEIQDAVNGVQRFIAPSGFAAGLLSALGPQFSSLNVPLNGIIATQKSVSGLNYTQADIAALVHAGIDVIANPSVGGTYFSCQTGNNASSNAAINGDNYTKMTDYIAATINAAAGQFVGGTNVQSPLPNDPYRAQVKAALDGFFANMVRAGQIVAATVTCNLTNNTPTTIAQGYCYVNIAVTYLSVVRYLVIAIQGGQSVSVVSASTQPIAA